MPGTTGRSQSSWNTATAPSPMPVARTMLPRHQASAPVSAHRRRRPAGSPLPDAAHVRLDELTAWGDADQAREGLDRWSGAGADLPVVVLPPGADVDELDAVLESNPWSCCTGWDWTGVPGAGGSRARRTLRRPRGRPARLRGVRTVAGGHRTDPGRAGGRGRHLTRRSAAPAVAEQAAGDLAAQCRRRRPGERLHHR